MYRASTKKCDHATFQIITGINDFHLPLMNEVPDDLAPRQDLGGVASCVLANGIVDEIPGLAPLRFCGWDDRVNHGPDRPLEPDVFFHHVAGCLDCTAALMPQDNDQWCAEMLGAVLDCTHDRCIGDISRIAGDKEFTDADTAENELWRYAAIRAGQNRRPWRLVSRRMGAPIPKSLLAQLRCVHEPLVSRLQPGQGFVRRQVCRREPWAQLTTHGPYARRGDPAGRERHKVPTAHPNAVNAHGVSYLAY